MTTVKRLLYLATGLFILFACSRKSEPIEQETTFIEISNQQLSTDSMKLGEIERRPFEETVKCNGIIVPLPKGVAKINVPLAGVIRNIYCQTGQLVSNNQTLLEIGGNEVIDIQRDLAEAAADFKRLKSEFDRLQSLYNEKVTSQKDFILAESAFKSAQAKYNGLKLKIERLGLPVTRIENGEFHTFYVIKSPIKGYVSNMNASIGSYIQPETELIEIINPSMFQLKLSVFPADVSNLKNGQKVNFKSANTDKEYSAEISSVGVTVDSDSRSIECYATITNKHLAVQVANQFVECMIVTNTDTVSALPTDAIIKNETGNYVLVLNKQQDNKYLFDKVEVQPGRQSAGYTEIKGGKIDGKVLVRGGYNVTL